MTTWLSTFCSQLRQMVVLFFGIGKRTDIVVISFYVIKPFT